MKSKEEGVFNVEFQILTPSGNWLAHGMFWVVMSDFVVEANPL